MNCTFTAHAPKLFLNERSSLLLKKKKNHSKLYRQYNEMPLKRSHFGLQQLFHGFAVHFVAYSEKISEPSSSFLEEVTSANTL